MYSKELVSIMIFTTLMLLAFVFGSLYYYTCSLPQGCMYGTHFGVFFLIVFLLLIIMIRIEKHKIKTHVLKIHHRIKRRKVKPIKPLDSVLAKFKYLDKNLKEVNADNITECCKLFKELVVKLLGICGNFTYEELKDNVEKADIDAKLKKDLTKTLSFLENIQYRNQKISLQELHKLIRYARGLIFKYNLAPANPQTKLSKIQPNICTREPLIARTKYIAGILVFVIVLSMYLAGGAPFITGHVTYDIAQGTGGSVTIFTIDDQTVVEGHNLSITVYANDSDSEALIFDIGESDPSWVSITTISNSTSGGVNATGTLTFSPASTGVVGDNYDVTVIVRSVDSDAASEGIYVNVTDNQAPSAHTTIPDMAWPEDIVNNSYDLDDYFNDTENDTLSYTYSGNTNITISITDGALTLTPDANWNGSETITFTASDGIDSTDSNTVTMNVTSVYDLLEISDIAVLPVSPNNQSNLNCTWTVLDNDTSANITAEVYWYLWNTTDWVANLTDTGISCAVNAVCSSSELLSYLDTSINDQWNCSVNVTDQLNYTFLSINTTVTSAAPDILTISVDSDDYNRTPINSTVLFNITWSDVDSLNASMFICNSSSGNTSGCEDMEYCGVNSSTDSSLNCSYTVLTTDIVNTSVWIFACDSAECNSNASAFYVNQLPEMYTYDRTFDYMDGAVAAVGDFDSSTFTHQQSFLKFNSSGWHDYSKVNISNATLTITTTAVNGNWSGNVSITGFSDQAWTSSTSAEDLTSYSNGSSSDYNGINTTGVLTFNISDLVTEAYALNQTNFSIRIRANDGSGTVNDSRVPDGYFAVGDNDTDSDLGELLFSIDTNVTVNLTKLLPDYQWNMNVVQSGPDLDDYFYDPDGYALNFTQIENSYVTASVDNITHEVTFTPTAGWYGTTNVSFNVTDVATGEILSNALIITLNYVAGDDTATTTTTTSSSSSTVKRMSVKITANDIVMYSTDAKVVDMVVTNTGDVDLSSIALAALFPNIDGLNGYLKENSISGLEPDQNVTIGIPITTNSVDFGSYNVTLTANVGDPSSVRDTAIFTIKIEDDEDSFAGKVRFVQDLFKTNSECSELLPKITDAIKLYKAGKQSLAEQNLDKYVEECKDRLSEDDPFSPSEAKHFFDSNKYTIILGLAFLSVLYMFSLFLNRT